MIEFFKNWCEGIIVAIMISIIIEAILPEGNHKKYVKVVIGIYVIFTILHPVLQKLDTNIELSSDFNLATIETSAVDTSSIQEVYLNGIQETLKHKLEEEFEYEVKKIEIFYDENYENIEKITLKITQGIAEIEKVEIGNTVKEEKIKQNYEEIKQYIAENYELDQSKIFINE